MSVATYYRFEVTKHGRTQIEYVWASNEWEARDTLKARLLKAWGPDAKYQAKWTRTTSCPGLN